MTSDSQSAVGLILAGGLSRRMGGGDKALTLLGGQRMIDRVRQRLTPQVSRLLINSNGDQMRDLGLPILPDLRPDFPGPLAGVEAGLSALGATESWLVTAPCDGPFLPLDLAERLMVTARSHQACVVLAASGGRDHPVFGLWHRSLLSDLRRFLDGGGRKVDAFTARQREARCVFPFDDGRDPFFNANRPEDLAQAKGYL